MHVEGVEWWTRDDYVAMTDKDGGGTRGGTVAAGSYVERVFESVASRSRRVREDSTSTTCSEQAAQDEFDQWLWEAQGQHEYEAAGELSDCMYHHAQGGLHGRGRVRMFLPALNKGNESYHTPPTLCQVTIFLLHLVWMVFEGPMLPG